MSKSWKSRIFLGLILVFSFMVGKCAIIHRYTVKKNLSKIVMGYYFCLEKEKFDHNKIKYRYLTHIAYAFTKPDSEGNLIVGEDYIYPELIETAHKNKVKVVMSIGGWGNSEGFPGMTYTSANRKRFINQVLEFCKKNNYDGVDIDWEYVSNPVEQQNYVYFIKELSTILKEQNPPFLLTMAAPAGERWARWINFEELIDYFDYISCMTYDFHGAWSDHSGHNSPLYTCNNDPCSSINDGCLYFLSRQVPKEKLLLGIPFYGRSFDCSNLYQKFQKSSYYGYVEILNFINSGWSYIWDDCAKVPYIQNPDKAEILCFDDARSITLKCKYIKEKQVAGAIIWELSQDCYQDSSVLLEVIGKEFRKRNEKRI
ncbi:MAG: glycoside hydrolase family 18 protein [Candidatus Aminicenantes bacterium]|nr:glycoside hydrolase family 18 protein [Candidatus Aminicenantes bacterium]